MDIPDIPGIRRLSLSYFAPGIYFLCQDDEVVYIGKAIYPIARISEHFDVATRETVYTHRWQPKHIKFNRAYILAVDMDDLTKIETGLINKYQPRYNGPKKIRNQSVLEKYGVK